MIETTVSQRFNTQASTIIHTTLSATLHRQQSLREEHTEPIPISHILQHLPANQKLTGISPAPSSNSASSIVKEYINIMCAADNPTTLGKASSFMSSQGSNGGNGGTKIQVEFEIIRRRLRLRVFEGVVREKWGDNGVKIVRILMDKGKMDEKHVCFSFLLNAI
jgi:DNA-directed RNA polymerase III subunit RPC3